MSTQYATAADLASLGLSAQALSVITLDEQNEALLGASNDADGYLGSKFILPLISWGTDLKRAVCQLAAYDLLSQRGYNPEAGGNVTIRDRAKDARDWLKQVAANKIRPVVVDSSTNPSGTPAGEAGTTGFAYSVGAPANQPGGYGQGQDSGNFWANGIQTAFNRRGNGGATRGF
jgi:phage gp36-like protein